MALPRGRYAVEAAWGKFSLNLLISEGQRCNAQGEGSPFGHPGKVSLRISSTWTPREAEPRGRHTIDASWERLGTNFFMGSEFSLLMCIYPLCTSTPKGHPQDETSIKRPARLHVFPPTLVLCLFEKQKNGRSISGNRTALVQWMGRRLPCSLREQASRHILAVELEPGPP